MPIDTHERRRNPALPLRRPPRPRLIGAVVVAAFAAGASLPLLAGDLGPEPPRLAPVVAVGERVDTFSIGGFARGRFVDALDELVTEMDEGERLMIGRYLDRIFEDLLGSEGLGERGRLRMVYERTAAPDGAPRAVRVLGAEAAVRGSVHTAIVHESASRVGYFDDWGRSLDRRAWLAPLERARVSSNFGRQRMHPILGRRLPHLGVDFAAAEGTPVRAAADGQIVHAGRRGGYGNLVEIRHPNGFSTRYAHLHSITSDAVVGAPIRQGDVIGRVGQTGLATGPHLHFEVRSRGEAVDPMQALLDGAVGDNVDFDPDWGLQRDRIRRMITAVSVIRDWDGPHTTPAEGL